MQCKHILKDAWAITQSGQGMLWYGTIPAFFTTAAGVAWVLYQYFAFRDSPLFGTQSNHLETFALFAKDILFAGGIWSWLTIIGALVAVVGFLVVPPFCEAAVIGLVAARQRGREIRPGDGLAIGFAHFLRMFEYRAVMAVFSFAEWLTIVSIATRHFGFNTPFLILFAVLLFLALLFYLLFVYGDNMIVLEKSDVTHALTGSAKLVFANLKETLLMSILLLLIFVRMILNIVLLFLMPVLVAAVTGFFVSQAALIVALSLAVVAGTLAFVLAAYLAGTLNIFTTAAWTLTYLSLDRNRADDILASS